MEEICVLNVFLLYVVGSWRRSECGDWTPLSMDNSCFLLSKQIWEILAYYEQSTAAFQFSVQSPKKKVRTSLFQDEQYIFERSTQDRAGGPGDVLCFREDSSLSHHFTRLLPPCPSGNTEEIESVGERQNSRLEELSANSWIRVQLACAGRRDHEGFLHGGAGTLLGLCGWRRTRWIPNSLPSFFSSLPFSSPFLPCPLSALSLFSTPSPSFPLSLLYSSLCCSSRVCYG